MHYKCGPQKLWTICSTLARTTVGSLTLRMDANFEEGSNVAYLVQFEGSYLYSLQWRSKRPCSGACPIFLERVIFFARSSEDPTWWSFHKKYCTACILLSHCRSSLSAPFIVNPRCHTWQQIGMINSDHLIRHPSHRPNFLYILI